MRSYEDILSWYDLRMKGKPMVIQSYVPVIKDQTVLQMTKKSWEEWFTILDHKDAQEMTHTEIARFLYDKYLKENSWWCQMIANNYERSRGLKKKYETRDGFQVSATRTIQKPYTIIMKFLSSKKSLNQWLEDQNVEIKSTAAHQVVRLGWSDKKSIVTILLTDKNDLATIISVEHRKIANELMANTMKTYWKKKLREFPNL